MTKCWSSALVQQGLGGTWSGPWSPWSAANVLLALVRQQSPVQGGTPAVVDALKKMIDSTDVNLRVGTKVRQIQVIDDAVTGVVLDTGETIETDTVCATSDPKSTGLNLNWTTTSKFCSIRGATGK